MKPSEPNDNEQWEDLVRRLGGTPDQAQTPPAEELDGSSDAQQPVAPLQGPRDYQLAHEIIEDFRPPEPKALASGDPRAVISWVGVVGSVFIWILAALLSTPLPWWLSTATLLAFLGGAVSLFFLLPKTWAHRDPFDEDNYGDGAKL